MGDILFFHCITRKKLSSFSTQKRVGITVKKTHVPVCVCVYVSHSENINNCVSFNNQNSVRMLNIFIYQLYFRW